MTDQQNLPAATEAKAPSPAKTIGEILKRNQKAIAAVLPKHMTMERMARIALTEFRKTPTLHTCSPDSFFGAVIQAAQLGLEPGSALGHAYLVPYKGQVQLIIGYRGMIDLARRSGQIISLQAQAVFEKDDFEYNYGLHPDIKHVPAEGERGEFKAVYAIANLKGGGYQFEVMSKAAVDAIKKDSPGSKRPDSPWNSHYEEMAKKTAIRRLFKYLPVSIEIQQALNRDEMTDAGVLQDNAQILVDADDYEVLAGEGDKPTAEKVGAKLEAEAKDGAA